MLEGGHADNALPQTAKATVNCRIFPGVDPKQIQKELQQLAGPKVEVSLDAFLEYYRPPRRFGPTWSMLLPMPSAPSTVRAWVSFP